MDNGKLFVRLLRSALWGGDIGIDCLTDEEYDGVMLLARQHAVEALIGKTLIRNNVTLSRERAARLMGVIKMTERENIRINRQLTEIVGYLRQWNTDYYVVKGQVLGTYYPSPLMRRSGDIDIFVATDYNTAVKQLARLEGMTCCKGNEKGKHQVMVRGGVVLELHRNLLLLATPRHRRAWESFVCAMRQDNAYVIINGCELRTMPLYGHLVYVFMHLYFHLITSGVGLRQLCDMAILLQKGTDECVDWEKVMAAVTSFGCGAAFRAVVACCVDELGVTTSLPIMLSKEDHRWGKRVFRNILRAGNFGCAQRVIRTPGRLHQIETAVMVIRNSLSFLRLAPLETLLRAGVIIENGKLSEQREQR